METEQEEEKMSLPWKVIHHHLINKYTQGYFGNQI